MFSNDHCDAQWRTVPVDIACRTTWLQQILGQLIFQGAEDVRICDISPWLDLRLTKDEAIKQLDKQQHRRVIKTHLQRDALELSRRVKYIYVARDGRDTLWSLYNHHCLMSDATLAALNAPPGLFDFEFPRPEPDVVKQYDLWMKENGKPFWPFWEHVRSWWEVRDLPNVLILHYADLKKDMAGEIRKISRFIGEEVEDDGVWGKILDHCSFEFMKSRSGLCVPCGGRVFRDGGAGFINKGTNGRWRDCLSAEQVADYDARAKAELGEECAAWLAHGSSAGVKPGSVAIHGAGAS